MPQRVLKTVLFTMASSLTLTTIAIAQQKPDTGAPPTPIGISGSGTPGTVPLWTGAGKTLTDSHIQDSGSAISIGVPVSIGASVNVTGNFSANDSGGNTALIAGGGVGVSGTGTDVGVQGNGPTGVRGLGTNGAGVSGNSNVSNGVVGTTSTNIAAGVAGFNHEPTAGGAGVYGEASAPNGVGIIGFASATTGGQTHGVHGITNSADAGAMGVFGQANAATGVTFGVDGVAFSPQGTGIKGESPQGVGVAGFNQSCRPTCVLGAGIAGFFVTGTGGNLLVGSVGPEGGPASVSFQVFRVDSTGKGFFDGGTQTGGADFAEVVAVKTDDSDPLRYEPGDVLSVDADGSRRLTLANTPYSTRVAGIYSTKPGVLATEHAFKDLSAGEVPLAIVGIVPCKVSAENGAVAPGDLLVTSSTPGFAMRGTDRSLMLGAVVGKALQPLARGKGVIQVLVTLQ